jgi:Rho-type GTPase-activating protein 1/2
MAMKSLLQFCHKITQFEELNKMTSRNLGIVFGPTVMRAPDPLTDLQNAASHTLLFKLFIENWESLFSGD